MIHDSKSNLKKSNTKLFVVIAGGNIGDTISHTEYAYKKLKKLAVSNKVLKSSVYKTKAWGKTDQPDFLNLIFVFKSIFPPHFILKRLLEIEKQRGRVRREKWGSRTLDLDILYCGNDIVNIENLKLPHPGIPDRLFCLIPLVEVLPKFKHPVYKLTNEQLLKKCKDNGDVRKY